MDSGQRAGEWLGEWWEVGGADLEWLAGEEDATVSSRERSGGGKRSMQQHNRSASRSQDYRSTIEDSTDDYGGGYVRGM